LRGFIIVRKTLIVNCEWTIVKRELIAVNFL
jgi:hypothetical protein